MRPGDSSALETVSDLLSVLHRPRHVQHASTMETSLHYPQVKVAVGGEVTRTLDAFWHFNRLLSCLMTSNMVFVSTIYTHEP